MQSVISIILGAILGALLRWKIAEVCNPIFPILPMGTLLVNLAGAFLMGCAIFCTTEQGFFSQETRLGIITGFLGSFTTFSTFSAEALVLYAQQEIFWLASLIGLHVGGTILMVACGYAASKKICGIFWNLNL